MDEYKKKKRLLGNVNFIGELFLAKVINKRIINICTGEMIAKFIQEFKEFKISNNQEFKNYPDNIEGIIILYDLVGKKISLQPIKQEEADDDKKNIVIIKNYIMDIL